MAMLVDTMCNELGITIPVAIHADHYGIKNEKDLAAAKIEIPTMFEAGMTSIAIDASHLPDDKTFDQRRSPLSFQNGRHETEVGEIRGRRLTVKSVFSIQGLNAAFRMDA
jgi:fructose-bisphosphate aldolase class II